MLTTTEEAALHLTTPRSPPRRGPALPRPGLVRSTLIASPPSRGASPSFVGRSDAASDAEVARRLSDVSEDLTGIRFPLVAATAAG